MTAVTVKRDRSISIVSQRGATRVVTGAQGPAASSSMGDARRTVTSGAVTISASTDDLVIVAMSPPAATNVTFPTVAARIAANGRWIGLKNNHANPALYPLQPVRSGTNTIDDKTTPLKQSTNRVIWYKPVAATGDWEIQTG